ncbi:MAG: hypothetical protein ACLSHE_09905 [Roseburia sp.]
MTAVWLFVQNADQIGLHQYYMVIRPMKLLKLKSGENLSWVDVR